MADDWYTRLIGASTMRPSVFVAVTDFLNNLEDMRYRERRDRNKGVRASRGYQDELRRLRSLQPGIIPVRERRKARRADPGHTNPVPIVHAREAEPPRMVRRFVAHPVLPPRERPVRPNTIVPRMPERYLAPEPGKPHDTTRLRELERERMELETGETLELPQTAQRREEAERKEAERKNRDEAARRYEQYRAEQAAKKEDEKLEIDQLEHPEKYSQKGHTRGPVMPPKDSHLRQKGGKK